MMASAGRSTIFAYFFSIGEPYFTNSSLNQLALKLRLMALVGFVQPHFKANLPSNNLDMIWCAEKKTLDFSGAIGTRRSNLTLIASFIWNSEKRPGSVPHGWLNDRVVLGNFKTVSMGLRSIPTELNSCLRWFQLILNGLPEPFKISPSNMVYIMQLIFSDPQTEMRLS